MSSGEGSLSWVKGRRLQLGEAGEAFLQGEGEVSQGVDWEVPSQRSTGESRSPAKGEIDR